MSLVAQLVRIHLQCGRPGFDPWVGKTPWRRERLPTPVFWPGKFHGLYSPWGRKELDRTEQLSLSLCQHTEVTQDGLHPWSHRNGIIFRQVGICKQLFARKSSLQEALVTLEIYIVTNLKPGAPMLCSSLAQAHLSNLWSHNPWPNLLGLSMDQRHRKED